MNIQSAHPSKFIKAADLNGSTVRVTIDTVTVEEVGQGADAEMKPVLYMQGKEKGMVLNVVNSNTIADAYGDETDNWNGRPLDIYPTTTEFGGKMVPCLRVRVPKDADAPIVNPNEPPPAAEADIPF